MAKFALVFYGFLIYGNIITTFFISYRISLLFERILRCLTVFCLTGFLQGIQDLAQHVHLLSNNKKKPLHEEIFIQFDYQEAATKRCFYRGHLEILASASQHEHRHWHRHCKKIIFAIRIFFFLKKSRIFMFFLVLSYGISTTLLQILSSLRFPIHSVKGVHWCSRKKLFEHSEASILVF